jgi:hypothetical protein
MKTLCMLNTRIYIYIENSIYVKKYNYNACKFLKYKILKI